MSTPDFQDQDSEAFHRDMLDREDEMIAFINSLPKEYAHEQLQRALTAHEQRVNFAAAQKTLNKTEISAGRKLQDVLRATLKKVIDWVDVRQNNLSPDLVAQFALPQSAELRDIIRNMYLDQWRSGRDLASKELPKKIRDSEPLSRLKQFVRNPLFSPAWLYAEWDESKHPRAPSGSEKGGEFAPAGGGSELSGAINSFVTSGRFLQTNRDLRAGRSPQDKTTVEQLDKMIEGSVVAKEATVYRGMLLSSAEVDDLYSQQEAGEEYVDRGFMSASFDKKVATKFANRPGSASTRVLVEISAKTGTNALDISHLNKYREKELLFPRGASFKIRDILDETGDQDRPFIILKLESIPIAKKTNQLTKAPSYWAELAEQAVKTYAITSGLEPQDAIRAFNARAWMIESVIDNDLQGRVRYELFEHLKGGRTLRETISNIRQLFEPWTGDPSKIQPSGTSDTPEDVLQAYRIENIVRTESTWAFNQGRVAVADAAGDYSLGFQFSAIIDTRTTPQCKAADGLVIRKDDPRLIKLTPPLFYNCRSILTFVTQDDVPVDWSPDSEVDKAVALVPSGFK